MDFEAVRADHGQYVTNVSLPQYAVGWEVVESIWRELERVRPATLCDCGSGFTSYLLRLWAKENGGQVTSLDTDPDWLAKSKAYAEEKGVGGGLWKLWDDRSGSFDFLFYDLGVISVRERMARASLDLVAPNGTWMGDDLHWAGYDHEMAVLAAQQGSKLVMEPESKDKFGRFAGTIDMPAEKRPRQTEVSVIIGFPFERTIPSETEFSRVAFAQQGFAYVNMGYSRTDLGRCMMAKHLLENPEFTHLLMLDTDHLHPADTVARLVRHVQKDPKKLVIGGLNYRRGPPFEPNVYFLDPEGKVFTLKDFPKGIVKVHLLGTCAMLVAREAFERIPCPWFKYNYEQADQYKFPSEDTWFSLEALRHGVGLWCDTTCTSPHMIVEWADKNRFERYVAEHPDVLTKDGLLYLQQ
ncbi:MAG: hypothetical protein BWY79_00093 [Actinobacteria bacterium ADurb.Bin444]|nr:MAG: hypothetical protein BWY79_00093 [Actinobacteria bacterium ADurb.Bin444]